MEENTSRPQLILLTLASSVLLPLALPSEFLGWVVGLFGKTPDQSLFWGNAVLGFVCIAPAFYAVSRAPTFGFASVLGMLFAAVSTALGNYWLMFFQGYSIWTMGGTIVGYVGYNALLFPFLRGFSRVSVRYRPFLLAAAWAAYEYFKSVGFLGYPWGLIAYPASGVLPLIQFVDITGVWGLSFLIALINALVSEWALSGTFRAGIGLTLLRRQSLFVLLLVGGIIGYGAYKLASPIPSDKTASLLLVQQNVDPWDEGRATTDSLRINLDLTRAGIQEANPAPDLAVWSESSVSNIWVDGNLFRPSTNALVPFVRETKVPVLFGGIVVVDYESQQAMNAAILVSREGEILDTYGKMHPVPFAESIPFIDNPAVFKFFKNVVGIWNPWVMGSRYTVFKVPIRGGGEMSFGVPICFEDAFSYLCRGFILRGADLLINITNDSWSKTWSAEIQHFVVARLRAVENRRVLVRSTNGGLTSVVGPWGEIRLRFPLFERMYGGVEVPLYRERNLSPYTRFGDYFPFLLCAGLLAALVSKVLPGRRRK